jgi:hypothetical protein
VNDAKSHAEILKNQVGILESELKSVREELQATSLELRQLKQTAGSVNRKARNSIAPIPPLNVSASSDSIPLPPTPPAPPAPPALPLSNPSKPSAPTSSNHQNLLASIQNPNIELRKVEANPSLKQIVDDNNMLAVLAKTLLDRRGQIDDKRDAETEGAWEDDEENW